MAGADGPTGSREILIDLTTVTARTIRAATNGVKIGEIRINGTAGSGAGNVVLRTDVASTGDVVFQLLANNDAHDGTFSADRMWTRGLFMDVLATAWLAGSTMIIVTK